MAGTAGAGYLFLNQLDDSQLKTYGNRVGALTATYGPHVFDTYGYANLSTHIKYAQAAAEGGAAPAAFVTQPNWGVPQPVAYDAYHCDPDGGNFVLKDENGRRTPLICTPGKPNLFYYSSSLEDSCPSCDLSNRIGEAAKQHSPPHFITVYGGLQAFGGADKKSKKSFWTLLGDTVKRLGDDFVVIGATEMARLSREAMI